MKSNRSVNLSSREARNMLACAFENAVNTARKNCDAFCAWNPGQEERRRHELDIELCGINNLYYRMIDELDRIEKISRSA